MFESMKDVNTKIITITYSYSLSNWIHNNLVREEMNIDILDRLKEKKCIKFVNT